MKTSPRQLAVGLMIAVFMPPFCTAGEPPAMSNKEAMAYFKERGGRVVLHDREG